MTLVVFKDKFDEGKRYLQISDGTLKTTTELLVYEPILGEFAQPWPKLSRADYETENWTDTKSFGVGDLIVRHTLLQQNYSLATAIAPSQLLRSRISSSEALWGEDLRFRGEFKYVRGYWEWAEEILVRSHDVLLAANIYDAVYASLYTWDCLPAIIRAFCESWSPSTNTLFTAEGESSISLWDLHKLGGLPILGKIFDEVVLSARELQHDVYDGEDSLPPTCAFLLHAYHSIFQAKGRRPVSIENWIRFWSNRISRYNAPPQRKEHKPKRSTLTHNPTGVLPRVSPWSEKDIDTFSHLNVPDYLRDETYLAAFLSCWLCCFVLPVRSIGNDRLQYRKPLFYFEFKF